MVKPHGDSKITFQVSLYTVFHRWLNRQTCNKFLTIRLFYIYIFLNYYISFVTISRILPKVTAWKCLYNFRMLDPK